MVRREIGGFFDLLGASFVDFSLENRCKGFRKEAQCINNLLVVELGENSIS